MDDMATKGAQALARAERCSAGRGWTPAPGVVTLSLAFRRPFDAAGLLDFLSPRTVRGVEAIDGETYTRTLRLPRSHGTVELTPGVDNVRCKLRLVDLADLSSAVERCRRLFDLDADPVAIDTHLSGDDVLRSRVVKRPGLRVPGHVDGFEVVVRAVVGQQVSVAGARTIVGRLTAEYGERIADEGPLTHLFPSAEAIAAVDPDRLPMVRARGRALVQVASAVAAGDIVLDRSADRDGVRRSLLALPGIGSWTADYIALRALGDPDVFLPTDLGVKHGLARLGVTGKGAGVAAAWSPWRSYALMHVWAVLGDDPLEGAR